MQHTVASRLSWKMHEILPITGRNNGVFVWVCKVCMASAAASHATAAAMPLIVVAEQAFWHNCSQAQRLQCVCATAFGKSDSICVSRGTCAHMVTCWPSGSVLFCQSRVETLTVPLITGLNAVVSRLGTTTVSLFIARTCAGTEVLSAGNNTGLELGTPLQGGRNRIPKQLQTSPVCIPIIPWLGQQRGRNCRREWVCRSHLSLQGVARNRGDADHGGVCRQPGNRQGRWHVQQRRHQRLQSESTPTVRFCRSIGGAPIRCSRVIHRRKQSFESATSATRGAASGSRD